MTDNQNPSHLPGVRKFLDCSPSIQSLADAIVCFERRVKVSPTLREVVRFPEYAALVQALVRERDALLTAQAKVLELTGALIRMEAKT